MGVHLMPGELHEVSEAIGSLKAQVATLNETLQRYQEATTIEHRKVHDIIEALSDSVRTLTATVREMKPLTDDYREKRAEARGARRLMKIMYALAGGGIATILGQLFQHLFGGGAPPAHP